MERVPPEAQNQRREGGALHLSIDGDPQEQRVWGDLLQLVGRHVQPEGNRTTETISTIHSDPMGPNTSALKRSQTSLQLLEAQNRLQKVLEEEPRRCLQKF